MTGEHPLEMMKAFEGFRFHMNHKSDPRLVEVIKCAEDDDGFYFGIRVQNTHVCAKVSVKRLLNCMCKKDDKTVKFQKWMSVTPYDLTREHPFEETQKHIATRWIRNTQSGA